MKNLNIFLILVIFTFVSCSLITGKRKTKTTQVSSDDGIFRGVASEDNKSKKTIKTKSVFSIANERPYILDVVEIRFAESKISVLIHENATFRVGHTRIGDSSSRVGTSGKRALDIRFCKIDFNINKLNTARMFFAWMKECKSKKACEIKCSHKTLQYPVSDDQYFKVRTKN